MSYSSEEKTWSLDDYEAMRANLNISPLCLRVPTELLHWDALHGFQNSRINTAGDLVDDNILRDEDREYLREPTGYEFLEAMILSAANTPPAQYKYTVLSPDPLSAKEQASKFNTRRPHSRRRHAPLTRPRSTKAERASSLPVNKKPLLSEDDILLAYNRLSCMERGEKPSVFSQVIVGRPDQVPRFESMRELYEDGKVNMLKLDQIYAGHTEWEVPRLDIRPLFRGPFTHGANLYCTISVNSSVTRNGQQKCVEM